MSTFLFDSTIFGPVKSRRLGESLGINLLPNNKKICNFNCLYCECGLSTSDSSDAVKIPKRNEIKELLKEKLKELHAKKVKIDTITFAGNGEPTLHPNFPEIIDDVIEVRSKYFPEVKIAVLSNATFISDIRIFNALVKADKNILKLDSAIPGTQYLINCPNGNFSITETIKNLKMFNGNVIIQTLFFKGTINGKTVDNTSKIELEAWLKAINEIKPESVMIYTIARDTPVKGLKKITIEELNIIAKLLEENGHKVLVSP